MAQQASPHWYTHKEYLRAVLSSLVSGWGILPLSTRPIRWFLDPAEDALAPGVQQPEREDRDEDEHLDEPEDVVHLEADGPGEDEHRFDVEHDEQQGEDVVADLALRPPEPHGIDAGLVIQVLLGLDAVRPDEAAEAQHAPHDPHRDGEEDDRREVVAEET